MQGYDLVCCIVSLSPQQSLLTDPKVNIEIVCFANDLTIVIVCTEDESNLTHIHIYLTTTYRLIDGRNLDGSVSLREESKVAQPWYRFGFPATANSMAAQRKDLRFPQIRRLD